MKIEVTDTRNEQDDAFVASQLRSYNATFGERDFELLRAIRAAPLMAACWPIPTGNISKSTSSE